MFPPPNSKKDFKRIAKRGYDLSELQAILGKLANREELDPRNRDHALSGSYAGFRECHIRPDWLLVYAIDNDRLILTASRTGAHSDLFDE